MNSATRLAEVEDEGEVVWDSRDEEFGHDVRTLLLDLRWEDQQPIRAHRPLLCAIVRRCAPLAGLFVVATSIFYLFGGLANEVDGRADVGGGAGDEAGRRHDTSDSFVSFEELQSTNIDLSSAEKQFSLPDAEVFATLAKLSYCGPSGGVFAAAAASCPLRDGGLHVDPVRSLQLPPLLTVPPPTFPFGLPAQSPISPPISLAPQTPKPAPAVKLTPLKLAVPPPPPPISSTISVLHGPTPSLKRKLFGNSSQKGPTPSLDGKFLEKFPNGKLPDRDLDGKLLEKSSNGKAPGLDLELDSDGKKLEKSLNRSTSNLNRKLMGASAEEAELTKWGVVPGTVRFASPPKPLLPTTVASQDPADLFALVARLERPPSKSLRRPLEAKLGASQTEQHVIIAVRGSVNSREDQDRDARTELTKGLRNCPGCRVHRGFFDSSRHLLSHVLSVLKEQLLCVPPSSPTTSKTFGDKSASSSAASSSRTPPLAVTTANGNAYIKANNIAANDDANGVAAAAAAAAASLPSTTPPSSSSTSPSLALVASSSCVLHVTGHASGAAVASLLAWELVEANYSIGTSYLFESPQMGNDRFAAEMSSRFAPPSRSGPLLFVTSGASAILRWPFESGYQRWGVEVQVGQQLEKPKFCVAGDQTCRVSMPGDLQQEEAALCRSTLAPEGDFCHFSSFNGVCHGGSPFPKTAAQSSIESSFSAASAGKHTAPEKPLMAAREQFSPIVARIFANFARFSYCGDLPGVPGAVGSYCAPKVDVDPLVPPLSVTSKQTSAKDEARLKRGREEDEDENVCHRAGFSVMPGSVRTFVEADLGSWASLSGFVARVRPEGTETTKTTKAAIAAAAAATATTSATAAATATAAAATMPPATSSSSSSPTATIAATTVAKTTPTAAAAAARNASTPPSPSSSSSPTAAAASVAEGQASAANSRAAAGGGLGEAPTPTSRPSTIEDGVVLVIRGSIESRADMIRDKETKLSSNVSNCPGCKAHYGYLKSYQRLLPIVTSHLKEFWCGPSNCKIYLAGHSSGAAVATLLGRALAEAGYTIGTSYLFGSPRVGNEGFADALTEAFSGQERHGVVFHVVEAGDPVHEWPPESEGYRPWGIQTHVEGKQEKPTFCLAGGKESCSSDASKKKDLEASATQRNCKSSFVPGGSLCKLENFVPLCYGGRPFEAPNDDRGPHQPYTERAALWHPSQVIFERTFGPKENPNAPVEQYFDSNLLRVFAMLSKISYCGNLRGVADAVVSSCSQPKSPCHGARLRVAADTVTPVGVSYESNLTLKTSFVNETLFFYTALLHRTVPRYPALVPTESCLVVFRGAVNAQNALMAARGGEEVFLDDPDCKGCSIQKHLLDAWRQALRDHVLRALASSGCWSDPESPYLSDQSRRLIAGGLTGAKSIILVGHGLGGEIAALAAYFLRKEGFDVELSYFLESRLPGNAAFRTLLSDPAFFGGRRPVPFWQVLHDGVASMGHEREEGLGTNTFERSPGVGVQVGGLGQKEQLPADAEGDLDMRPVVGVDEDNVKQFQVLYNARASVRPVPSVKTPVSLPATLATLSTTPEPLLDTMLPVDSMLSTPTPNGENSGSAIPEALAVPDLPLPTPIQQLGPMPPTDLVGARRLEGLRPLTLPETSPEKLLGGTFCALPFAPQGRLCMLPGQAESSPYHMLDQCNVGGPVPL